MTLDEIFKRLPKRTLDYLACKPQEGQRHAEQVAAIQQLRDSGVDRNTAENIISPLFVRDGMPEGDARKQIYSIFSRPARPGIKHKVSSGHLFSVYKPMPTAENLLKANEDDNSKELPAPISDGALLFLQHAFESDEYVRIVQGSIDDKGKDFPASSGVTMTASEWIDRFENNPPEKTFDCMREDKLIPGVYVGINPMAKDGSKDADVSVFRHLLIEFDTIPLLDQFNLVVASQIPVSAIIHSGGKSIHALVRVDAKDRKEYNERADIILNYFKAHNPDAACKNPARTTRLPGCKRNTATVNNGRQELLQLRTGADSFIKWLDIIRDAELPVALDIDLMADFDRNNDPNCIIGNRWLCRAGTAILAGQSGIGKSSFLMQTAITWAYGKSLFGITPKMPLKSVIIQAENDDGDMSEMYQDSCRGMDIDLADRQQRAYLKEHVKIYREAVRTKQDFVRIVWRLLERDKPDLIFADPLMAYLADDAGKQDVVSEFLREQILPMILATKVIWFFFHHTPKPLRTKDKAAWSDKDMTYSSFGSSELANWPREAMTLQREGSGPENTYSLTLSKRGERSGMRDFDGNPATTIFLKHAERPKILWLRSDFKPQPNPEPELAPTKKKEEKHEEKKPAIFDNCIQEFLVVQKDFLDYWNGKNTDGSPVKNQVEIETRIQTWADLHSIRLGRGTKTSFNRIVNMLIERKLIVKNADGEFIKQAAPEPVPTVEPVEGNDPF